MSNEDRLQPQDTLALRYDYVVCGSGSSGSAVAGRLAANPAASVLLIEAGGTDDTPNVIDPNRWVIAFGSNLEWGFMTEPNPRLNGRVIPYTMGKVLGGGSSINVSTWSRGHRSDWDSCARETSEKAWSYESVLETYRRIEGIGRCIVVLWLPQAGCRRCAPSLRRLRRPLPRERQFRYPSPLCRSSQPLRRTGCACPRTLRHGLRCRCRSAGTTEPSDSYWPTLSHWTQSPLTTRKTRRSTTQTGDRTRTPRKCPSHTPSARLTMVKPNDPNLPPTW